MTKASKKDTFLSMLPIIFALASGNWSQDRKSVGDEEWAELLESNDLTPELFEKYEDWWFSSPGQKTLSKLQNQLTSSILERVVPDAQEIIETFLHNANWADFVRELADCSPGQAGYFVEYAVEQGLCWNFDFETLEEFNIGQDTINGLLELWFNESHDEVLEIFLSVQSDLAAIK
jgi:hypothetical protein